MDVDRDAEDLSPASALKLCSQFLSGSWARASEDDVSVGVLSGGMSNRLYVCKNQTNGEKVVIRLYGGKLVTRSHPYRTLDEAGEVILFYKMGVMSLGPKLLGAFPGGRLEEFVEGRPLHNDDFTKNGIEGDFVRALARMHSLDMPISKRLVDQVMISQDFINEFESTIRSRVSQDLLSRYSELFAFDYCAEINWLKEIKPQIATRTVFSHHDQNRTNFIVRECDGKLVLLDFEYAGYSSRGSDLGSHFNSRMIDKMNLKDFVSGLDYPDEEIRRTFVVEYLRETKEIGKFDDFDGQGLDSVDSLMMDSEFHSLVYAILFTIWFLRDYDQIVKFGDTFFVSKIEHLFYSTKATVQLQKFTTFYTKFYRDHKRKFVKKYFNKLKLNF